MPEYENIEEYGVLVPKNTAIPLREVVIRTEREDPFKIEIMPDQKLLEDFLRGMHGNRPITVIYNTFHGIFERIEPKQGGDE